ncbi:MAG: 5-formyltetrahydrofolate cyclo-ligase [Erysipelotrichaceae bacterium]|nr:5-formyltetrahydrofolate cyclo-ligase [Erysipelotrichaceae bacterium]
MDTKNIQRTYCKEKLESLSIREKEEYSDIILSRLRNIINDDKLLSYYPTDNEVNVLALNKDYTIAYPVCEKDYQMSFYIPENNKFITDKYGIHEPDIKGLNKEDISKYKYIIVPLLGFDEKCQRLGHGAGYYDRFLDKYDLIKIGVGFEVQKLDKVITETNDITLDYIVTEDKIYKKK